jgi:hypothetical protein
VLKRIARAATAIFVVAHIGCKGETSGPGVPVATTIAPNSATSITGSAGSVAAPAPSVIVKDQSGLPMAGVTVTFTVVSGGGSVSGETVTTDASGIATVGAWTLGPNVGENVLRAVTGSLAAVTFTATSTAGPAASIAKNGGDNQTAAAGTAVAIPPSVLVKDAEGNVKPGVTVTFAVVSGGGSVTGATATTNASGIATVGSWTLGPAAGANSLSAVTGSLAAVTFTATSTAGGAASVTKNAGDNQTATAGTAVAVAPSVLVKDANGNVTPGVTVTFAVVSGGGSITGAVATTNAAGIAAVGSWTLGTTPGANSLSATVAGLSPVTFTATGTAQLCAQRATHTFGTVTSGTLASGDCVLSDGSLVDLYDMSIAQAGAYIFRQGATFDSYLILATSDGMPIAENDDDLGVGPGSAIKALIPSGNFLLAPTSVAPGVTGSYEISSNTTSSEVTGCEEVFIARNVSTSQNITTSDCNFASAGATPIYGDGYLIFIPAGATVTINMTSTAIDPFLQLVRLGGTVIAQNDNVDGSTTAARITYTAPVNQNTYYAIIARAVPSNATGSYTLTVQ